MQCKLQFTSYYLFAGNSGLFAVASDEVVVEEEDVDVVVVVVVVVVEVVDDDLTACVEFCTKVEVGSEDFVIEDSLLLIKEVLEDGLSLSSWREINSILNS